MGKNSNIKENPSSMLWIITLQRILNNNENKDFHPSEMISQTLAPSSSVVVLLQDQ